MQDCLKEFSATEGNTKWNNMIKREEVLYHGCIQ